MKKYTLPALIIGLFGLWQFAIATDLTNDFKRAFGDHKILALGESVHELNEIKSAVYDAILELAPEINWVGLEISADEQPAIDAYMTSEQPPALEWSPLFKSFLAKAKALNQQRQKPLRILALDLPMTEYDQEGKWFLARDPFMVSTLQKNTDNFSGRGILFMGLAHVSKLPFQLPRLALSRMGGLRELTPLGALLEQTPELKSQIVRVAIHGNSPWIDRWASIPPDYKTFYALMSAQRPGMTTTSSLWTHEVLLDGRLPTRLGGNFDYLVNLPQQIDFAEECRLALKKPSALFRGVLLRAVDIVARVK